MLGRRSSFFTFLLVLSVALGASSCAAQTATRPAPAVEVVASDAYLGAIERARELVERRIAEGVPAFSVAVAIDGDLVWAEAQGIADLERQTAATTSTLFRIGSTSKPITATAAGRLLESGLVDFDADIRDVLPEFPQKRYPFTLTDLLSMQAGIRHYRGFESRNRRHFGSVVSGLQMFASDSLLFEPNTSVLYSSYSFNLAGAVLATAADRSFASLLRQEVFDPLEMGSSTVDDPTVEIPQRATFYSGNREGERVVIQVDDSYKAPSGGLLSTPSELVKFGTAVLTGLTPSGEPWLNADTRELLTTRRPLADGRTPGYALGFRVQPADADADPPGPRAIHHGGSSVGGRSMLYLLPDFGIVVSLLCNTDEYDTKEDDAMAIGQFFIEAQGR